ncbi:MAG TPA: D-alanyl-D-alanine carboxypeptidase [Niabella sp.]|nr:D-alanyl-D-alanine carboxypeptidase [Chitinophagaceae bacterium]HRO83704.1 D-alanyl-D-alanine carboxypeptidase [Niabella sp.]
MNILKAYTLCLLVLFVVFSSCTSQSRINKSAQHNLINSAGLKTAHVGISIYNLQKDKFIYNYNAEKYFVPASNTKIPTCYLAMKYLGDSIAGLKVAEKDDKVIVTGTGDPTLLDPEFLHQPVFEFLKKINKPIHVIADSLNTAIWGSGWSWDDYGEDYQPERSTLPVYSNVVWFRKNNKDFINFFPKKNIIVKTEGNGDFLKNVTRDLRSNSYTATFDSKGKSEIRVPFITNATMGWELLADTLGKEIHYTEPEKSVFRNYTIFSQPTDSVLRIMMHRSDNFFAEQMLLMVSNALLDKMTNREVIDTILKTDFKNIPQLPVWVDGSGLSRYNLFTPKDFVFILKKMNQDFGMSRIEAIFPTGGSGTISSYYLDEKGHIFVKTGTLSGVVALSGFIYTRKNQLLLFSILVNNHRTSASEVRRSIEKFLKTIRTKY